MKEFIKLYSQDPVEAKACYYKKKIGLDIKSNEGYKLR